MIDVEIIEHYGVYPTGVYREHVYKCALCGKKVTFYSVAPGRICGCYGEKMLPDMLELIKNMKCRLEHHFSKERY